MALASTSSASVTAGHSLTITAAARSAATGGLDLATALLADPGRLGVVASGGSPTVLFEGVKIGNAVYRAEVADLVTLEGATVDSDAVAVIARAETSGVQQSIRSAGRLIRPDTFKRADLDLSEFAVLLKESATIEFAGDSGITGWTQSPYASLREPLLVGTADGSAAIGPSDRGRLHGWAQLAIGPHATDSASADEELSEKRRNIASPVRIPDLPAPPAPADATPFVLPGDRVIRHDSAWSDDAILTSDVELNVGGGAPIVVDVGGSLVVQGTLRVAGPTVVIVRGLLELSDSSRIVIDPGASLAIVAFEDANLHAESIQNAETPFPPLADGTDAYTPGGLRFSLYCRGVNILVETVLFGEIYAPNAGVKINASTVYGRIVADRLQMIDSRLFYDPTLNSQRGWTNPDSAIWDANLPVAGMRLELGALTDFCDTHRVDIEVPRMLSHAALNSDSARDGQALLDRGRLEAERQLVRNRLLDGTYQCRNEPDPCRIAHRFKLREMLVSP